MVFTGLSLIVNNIYKKCIKLNYASCDWIYLFKAELYKVVIRDFEINYLTCSNNK